MKQYTVDDWLPQVMTRCPGATEELCRQEIADAVRQLCEEGWAWTETFGPMSAKANNPIIYLDPLYQNTRVGYVWLAMFLPQSGYKRRLTPMATSAAYAPTSDQPTAFLMEEPGVVRLNPIPIADLPNAFLFDLSVIPIDQTTRLPAVFRTHWWDAVIDGACSRMMMMVSKPWSNPSIGTLHGKRFRNHIKRARSITQAKYNQGQPWAFPDFAKQRVGESFI
jgi:hypothetical protein